MSSLPQLDTVAALQHRIDDLERENERLRAATAVTAEDVALARRSARQLFNVVESAKQGIVVHRGGPMLYVNPGLSEMLGLASREEYVAAGDVLAFVYPDDRPLVAAAVELFLNGRPVPATGEFRLLRRDGSPLWVEANTSTVSWDGEPAVLSVMSDISDRKDVEREWRRSRRLFQTAFDVCPEIMTISELRSGRYVDVNRTFLELSGYTREEAIGRTTEELGIFDRDSLSRLGDALRADRAVRDLEVSARTGTGVWREYVVSGEVLHFPDRDLVLMVARDITERRRHEKALRASQAAAEEANRAKSQFLAAMSHELRTPLNAILGFSELIRDEVFGPAGHPNYAEYAGDVHDSGSHLLSIINDLLDLSKLEAGKLELHAEAIAPAEVIGECLRLMRGRAADAGVALATALPERLPELHADHRLIKQILINLLSNAVKFTDQGGTVTAGAYCNADGGVTLYVADTGIGMSSQEQTVAMSPFGQVDGSLVRNQDGTGLGLPLSRQLAELHGGTLAIDSEPGTGTTVAVRLPAERVLQAPE